jgi:hypothetical protein
MYWTLQFASVCEPKNPGGAIGGVCQIGNGHIKPEIVNVHKPAEPTNSNFVGNYYTLLKGLERFAEMVAEDKSPELLIYTNEKILIEQMLGKYKIQVGVYQEYADACLDILSGIFGIGQNGYGFVQVGKEDVLKAKSVASKNSRLGIVPIAEGKPVEVKPNPNAFNSLAVLEILREYTEQIKSPFQKAIYEQARITDVCEHPDRIYISPTDDYAKEEISRNKDLLQIFQKRFDRPALFFIFNEPIGDLPY